MSTIDSLLLKSAKLADRKYLKGDKIVQQGRASRSLKILADGSADVSVDGKSVCMIMTKGAVFGEVSALLDTPAKATVTALETCYVHYAPDLPAIFLSHPEASWELARFLARRLVDTNKLIVNLKKSYQSLDQSLHDTLGDEDSFKNLKRKWAEAENLYLKHQNNQAIEDDTSGKLTSQVIPAGTVLMEEGKQTGKIWVLRRGSLDIVINGVKVGRLHEKGALVGEISALLDLPHSASVVTAEPSDIVVVEQVKGFFQSHPAASLQMARLLARRMSVTNEYFVNLREHFEELNKLLNESALRNPAKKGATNILAKKATETYTNAAQHINMAVFGGMLHPVG